MSMKEKIVTNWLYKYNFSSTIIGKGHLQLFFLHWIEVVRWNKSPICIDQSSYFDD